MVMDTAARRAAAVLAGAAYAALAVVILVAGVGKGHYETTSEYVIGYLFAAALVAVALAVGLLRDRSPRGATLVAAGSLLVAAGTMWGNLTGEDPDWFVVVGGPGNLLALAGCVLIARNVWPAGTSGRVLAVLLVLYVPASLVLAEIGGGLLAAALWLVVAARSAEPLDRPRPEAA